MSAHAVDDGKEPEVAIGDEAILVAVPHTSGVGRGAKTQLHRGRIQGGRGQGEGGSGRSGKRAATGERDVAGTVALKREAAPSFGAEDHSLHASHLMSRQMPERRTLPVIARQHE